MRKNHQLLWLSLSLASPALCAGTMGMASNNYNMGGLYAGIGTGLNTLFTKDSFVTTRASGLGGMRARIVIQTHPYCLPER